MASNEPATGNGVQVASDPGGHENPVHVALGRSIRSLSLTTVGAILFYALGVSYKREYFRYFGMDLGMVQLSLYDILYPAGDTVITLYHVILGVLASTTITPPRARTDALPPTRVTGFLELVLGVLGLAALVLSVIALFVAVWSVVPVICGTLIGFILSHVLRFRTMGNRVVGTALLGGLLTWMAGRYGTHDAEQYSPPVVKLVSASSAGLPQEALLIYYDHRNYFLMDYTSDEKGEAARRLRIVRDDRIDEIVRQFR